jgi:hypothetical protein
MMDCRQNWLRHADGPTTKGYTVSQTAALIIVALFIPSFGVLTAHKARPGKLTKRNFLEAYSCGIAFWSWAVLAVSAGFMTVTDSASTRSVCLAEFTVSLCYLIPAGFIAMAMLIGRRTVSPRVLDRERELNRPDLTR